jgi:hypothetical protein
VSHSEVTPREVEVEVEKREGAQAPPPAPKKSTPRKRGIPDDFQPDADRLKWAEINTPGVDLRRETEKFVEWHQAKGNTFVDHQKAWQNWMRRATPAPRASAPSPYARPDPPRTYVPEYKSDAKPADFEAARKRLQGVRGKA